MIVFAAAAASTGVPIAGQHVAESSLPAEEMVVCYLAIVVVGVILGLKSKITVFRNYSDLALCFGIPVLVLLELALAAGLGPKGNVPILVFVALAVCALLVMIIWRTWSDNRNPVGFLIALVTKLPLAILFVLSVVDFVAPKGTSVQRASARRRGFITLLLLTPLIYGLVRDKAASPVSRWLRL